MNSLEAKASIEKQPDLFNIIIRSSEEDGTGYVLIEHSKLKSILKKHLPKETSYEDGYKKGQEDCKKKLGSNGMRLNAMQSKDEKIIQIGTEVLRQLENREYTTHEEIGNTGIYSDKLYLSINQS